MSSVESIKLEGLNLNDKFSDLKYFDGFGSHISTEALPGALPLGQNSPQKCPYGLYAEQLSGTPFTAPRIKNQRSWLYRVRPSVQHSKFIPYVKLNRQSTSFSDHDMDDFIIDPNQLRWDPPIIPTADRVDFVEGLTQVCGSGSSSLKDGLCIYNYVASVSMGNKVFSSADGDMLIVPQEGILYITTELGNMRVEPCEIVVIQRGIKFNIALNDEEGKLSSARGYILEIFKGHFELPNLGPIGANGLANIRDFQTPVACFDSNISARPYTWINKFSGKLFQAELKYCPFNVVAWHGNYAPYKYDLRKFCCMNSVTFDHPDPSIYTVLTCPTEEPGTALADFVIFPPRWMVMEKSFRPPYYHRNFMTEYMGMIYGEYDAKEGGGFVPGGASLHSCMTPHGPDAATFIKASDMPLNPVYFDKGLAFMFETVHTLKLNPDALNGPLLQHSYSECWENLPSLFTGKLEE